MDAQTFAGLKYGNIISEAGRKFMVSHTSKDSAGNTIAIGVVEAFQAADAAALELVSANFSRTVMEGASDGSIVMMGQTVIVP